MERTVVPVEVEGWTDEAGEPVEVGEGAGEEHGDENRARQFWKEAAFEGEGSETVSERVHDGVSRVGVEVIS